MKLILFMCFFCTITFAQVSGKMPDKPRPATKVDPDNIHEKLKKKYPNSFQLSKAKEIRDSTKVIVKKANNEINEVDQELIYLRKAKERLLNAKLRLEKERSLDKIADSEFKKQTIKIELAEKKIREFEELIELKSKKNNKKH